MSNQDILILGKGYTSEHLEKSSHFFGSDLELKYTSRTDSKLIHFNLDDKNSWKNLPKTNHIIWTFPPSNHELCMEFYDKCLGGKNVVVVGTTGSFKVKELHEEITEKNSLDLSKDRAKAEQALLKKGAKLVFSSGIYGKGKGPVTWIEKGNVGFEDRFVNLIHVKDLCQFIWKALKEENKTGVKYLASDASPQKWWDIILHLNQNYGFKFPTQPKMRKKDSKRINPTLSVDLLGVKYEYPSIFDFFKKDLKSKAVK